MPQGGRGKHRRKDARWLLPFLHNGGCSTGSPAPEGSRTRAPELQKGPLHLLRCFGSRVSPLQWWEIRVSSEVGQRGGRSPTSPGSRSGGAGRSGTRSQTPAPPDAAPGSEESSDAAHRTAGAKGIRAPRVPAPSRPPPPPLLPHGSVRERNFLLGRPLRSPGVCAGRERRAARRLLLLLAAAGRVNPGACPPSEAAAAPAAPGRGNRLPAAPRCEEKPSRGPAVREPGAGSCSFLAQLWGGGGPGRAGAATPRAGRGRPGRREGLLRAASGRSHGSL